MTSTRISAKPLRTASSPAFRSALIGFGTLLGLFLAPQAAHAEGETRIERDDLAAEARLVGGDAAEVIVVTHAEGANMAEVTQVTLNGPNGTTLGPDMVSVREETVKAEASGGEGKGARVGAAVGAVLGGVLGSAADREESGAGTAAGTAGGAAAGAIAGKAVRKSAEKIRVIIARIPLINVRWKSASIVINYVGGNGKPSAATLPMPTAPAGPSACRPLDALVVNIQGDVSYQPAGETTWTKLKQGDKLQDGTRVKAGLKSYAIIQLSKTQFEVKPLTQATMTKFLEIPGECCTRIDLKNGGLSINFQKDRPRIDMRVSTPNCIAGVTG